MKCPNCGAENAEGKKFCGDCGNALPPMPGVVEQEQAILRIIEGQSKNREGWTPEDIRSEAERNGMAEDHVRAIMHRLLDRGDIYAVIYYRITLR